MERFYQVLIALRGFLNTNKWIVSITPHRIIIVFGALAIKLFYTVTMHAISLSYLGIKTYTNLHKTINFIFIKFPLLTITHFAYLLALWITLTTKDVKFVAYALWINVLINLYPFTSFSLNSLIDSAVYAFLGYLVYRFANSSYGKQMAESAK